MGVNWGMAGQGNNALAYFQLGQQLGQQIIDGRVNRAMGRILTEGQQSPAPTSGGMGLPPVAGGMPQSVPQDGLPPVAAGGMTPGIGDQVNRDLGRDWATLARHNPQAFMQLQADRARAQQAAQAQQANQAATMRRLLEMAGNNPQQAFAAAAEMGLDVSRVPQPGSPEFEPWRQTQLFILKAVETPEGKDMLTNTAKEVMLTLPPEQRDPNHPAFIAAMTKRIEAEAIKTIPYTEGGGVASFNPMTGKTKTIVAPNPGGYSAGTPVQGGDLPRVNSPEEARRLPPGSKFMTPDGRIGTVPGGRPAGAGPFAQ